LEKREQHRENDRGRDQPGAQPHAPSITGSGHR
jgi:hypothetical protein